MSYGDDINTSRSKRSRPSATQRDKKQPLSSFWNYLVSDLLERITDNDGRPILIKDGTANEQDTIRTKRRNML